MSQGDNDCSKARTPLSDAAREELRGNLSLRYRKPLMAYFRRRTGDAVEAEDFAQEVILRVIQRDDLAEIEQPDAFIFATARNLMRDAARRAEVRQRNRIDIEILDERSEGLSPERVIQSKQDLASALEALNELNEKTRDIFILHRLEGMKYREIADLYGISVSAVEKQLIKAVAHLMNSVDRE